MVLRLWPGFLASAFMLGTTPAQSAIDSIYTDIDLDECLVLAADDFAVSWACPGYKGFPLYVSEVDLRFHVSYGFGAPDELAAKQTLPAFNTIHSTLEWRASNATGPFIPFASILRYFTSNPDGENGETLVVTKIEPQNTCHIAYVDARAMPDANVAAREIADEMARDFECGRDEIMHVPAP